MKPLEAILAAALLAGLAGCAARAKQPVSTPAPAVPAPAPEPLSIPQTQVQLPPPQPLDPNAFSTAPPAAPAPEPPPPAAAKPAQTARPRVTPPAKPDPAPTEAVRPPIQEILPANEQQRLRKSAQDHRRLAEQLVAQARHRSLTGDEQARVSRINQFIKSSGDAEKNGDLRSADDLASRAHILAKELQSGK